MIKKLLLILFLLTSIVVSAQKDYTFSLEEAVNFALLNNKSSVNAKKDLAIAQKEKWETISRGLPQINSYFDFNNRLKDPISLIPAEFFGGKKGEFAEVSFGTKQSVSGELILNQLLFDGSYIIGLQSIELFLEIADQAKLKTDIEVKRQVSNAYGNVLVSQERVKILEKNYSNIIETLEETQIIYENGLIESESVDQLTITSSSIKNSLDYAIKFENLSKRILKLILGIELNDNVMKNNMNQ